MIGDALHRYDLELCDYVLSAFSWYWRDRPFVDALAEWLGRSPIWLYLDPHERPLESVLLTDEEIGRLATAVGAFPDRYCWHPDRDLHGRHILCVREIREYLSPTLADEWLKTSAHLAVDLERPGLRLSAGLMLVAKWVENARGLLEAMGAVNYLPPPEGPFATPTHPQVVGSQDQLASQASTVLQVATEEMQDGKGAVNNLPPRDGTFTTPIHPQVVGSQDQPADQAPTPLQVAIEKMRDAIATTTNGRNCKPEVVIKKAKINNKRARQALRELEELGEYDGFSRGKPERYRRGLPNER